MWALPPHMLERVSAADVVVAAEAALEAETRVPHVQVCHDDIITQILVDQAALWAAC